MQKIYEIAESEKIYIAYDDLQRIGGIQGLYTIDPRAGPLIVLDLSLLSQPKLHRCIAAHELGHHFCPPRSNATTFVAFYRGNQYSTNSQIIVGQDEHRALKWATELLMPSAEVWAALQDGYNTVPLLAEHFNVTEWFVRAKIGYMIKEPVNFFATSKIVGIVDSYCGLREPTVPISPGASRVHGINLHDVKGKDLDYERINELLNNDCQE